MCRVCVYMTVDEMCVRIREGLVGLENVWWDYRTLLETVTRGNSCVCSDAVAVQLPINRLSFHTRVTLSRIAKALQSRGKTRC